MYRYAFLILAVMAGCKATTETGYEPRKLGDSMTVQRGYYATPFSPEFRAAQEERQTDAINNNRPAPADWRAMSQ